MDAYYFFGEVNETRGGALSNVQKLETTLRFLGDPGFQSGIGNDIGIHQCTVSRVITSTLNKIVERDNEWVTFPTSDEELSKVC